MGLLNMRQACSDIDSVVTPLSDSCESHTLTCLVAIQPVKK